jgi:hypothetical protein
MFSEVQSDVKKRRNLPRGMVWMNGGVEGAPLWMFPKSMASGGRQSAFWAGQ